MLELNLSRPKLRVLSNIFGNFVVVWLIAMFGTRDAGTLTMNLVAAIVCWRLAVKVEESLEEL